jgi:Tfp pilus assembly protein PilZ
MDKEKRRHQRFIVEGKDIHAKTTFASEIEILDMSLGGARIKGTKNLRVSSTYHITLEREGKPFSLKCRVIWMHLSGSLKTESGETVPVYTAGVEFQDIFSGEAKGLLEFLEDYTASYELRLRGVRITIHGREKAVLNQEEKYDVMNISLGGILIQANQPMEIGSKFPMELRLSQEKDSVRFQGRIASCIERTSEDSKCYDVGIEFFDMEENERARLSTFIASLNE